MAPGTFNLRPINWVVAGPIKPFRFQGAPTSESDITVTRACLLSLYTACSNVAAGFVVPVYTAVRIVGVRLHMTGNPSNTTLQTVNFQWLSDVGKQVKYAFSNKSSLGFSSPYLRPPPMSRSVGWSREGSLTATLEEVLFSFNVAGEESGALLIVDLDLEVTSDTVSAAVITVTSPVLGLAYNALDCLSTSNGKGSWIFFPVGIDTSNGSNTAPSAFSRAGAKDGSILKEDQLFKEFMKSTYEDEFALFKKQCEKRDLMLSKLSLVDDK